MAEKYKGFELKGSTLRKKCEVAINLGDKRHHIATGDTMDDAYIAARAWVDRSFAAAKQGRRETHIATAEQYETYLRTQLLKRYERAMLAENAAGIKTAGELARAAGWSDYGTANLHYGKLGRKVGEALSLTFKKMEHDGSDFLISALANEVSGTKTERVDWKFEMHPELVQALKTVGIVE